MSSANSMFVPWIRINLKYDKAADFTQSTLDL